MLSEVPYKSDLTRTYKCAYLLLKVKSILAESPTEAILGRLRGTLTDLLRIYLPKRADYVVQWLNKAFRYVETLFIQGNIFVLNQK